jgi:nucleoside-diphosphate-sugar epimerase
MKKILITGASGFIGSFLVEKALDKEWETWAAIRKSSSREYLQSEKIQFILLDFSDKEKLKTQIAEHVANYGKWDFIVHNAGVTKCLNSDDFEKVNSLYTRHFIEALEECDSVPEKFLLMSSLSAAPNPETAYGKSKQKAENFLMSQKKFPYLILRPTGVYGPRDKDYYLMLKSMQAGVSLAAGFRPQSLTFIYVKDLVKVAFLALESPVRDKIYFVADGDVYSDHEYCLIAQKALGKKHLIKITCPLFLLKTVSILAEAFSKITRKPSTLNRDKYKIMKQRDWRCDVSPLKDDLGFSADYNLAQGMQECVEWYRAKTWLK